MISQKHEVRTFSLSHVGLSQDRKRGHMGRRVDTDLWLRWVKINEQMQVGGAQLQRLTRLHVRTC